MEYLLYLTNDCNLNCRYCSVLFDCKKNNIPLLPSYSNEEMIQFIRNTQEQEKEEDINIYFFGGEPTLEYERMESMMISFKEQLGTYNLKFILHTNGLLLETIPDNVLHNLSLIMFSVNDEKIPQYNLNDSYFSDAIKHVKYIKERSDVPVVARLTITEKTSLYTEILQVNNFFDMVYWQIENCRECSDYKTFYGTYTYEADLTFQYWLKYMERGILLPFVPFMAVLKFMFFHDRDDTKFCCGYGSHMLYIQTNGVCHACCDNVQEGIHKLGDIYEGVQFPHYNLKDFKCRDCKWRSICMGRCGRMHKEFPIDRVSQYCAMNQYVFSLFEKNRQKFEQLFVEHPEFEQYLSSWVIDTMEFTS